MSDKEAFSYGRFMSLSGSGLVSYAEPFVNTSEYSIQDTEYDLLVANLTRMDNEHIVYALEVCMAANPCKFAMIAVGFLAHPDGAVCCTAFRLLQSAPLELISADLVAKIASTPVVDLFANDLHSENRINVGSNKEFIRDLVARFS